MFWLFQTHDPIIIAVTIAVAVSFAQGIMFGPEATWVVELFAARLRYSGGSLGFQIGAALSGGLHPWSHLPSSCGLARRGRSRYT
jgi:MHS family shikimate/dehydroshikimate transporter-like MFS transporter